MSIWGYIPRVVVLGTAFWLIVDIILDGIQAPKYWKLSPCLNVYHEANLNLTGRMLQFCTKIECLQFNKSKLNNRQIVLYEEWMEKCKKSDFNFTNSYGISRIQLEIIKVKKIILCFSYSCTDNNHN